MPSFFFSLSLWARKYLDKFAFFANRNNVPRIVTRVGHAFFSYARSECHYVFEAMFPNTLWRTRTRKKSCNSWFISGSELREWNNLAELVIVLEFLIPRRESFPVLPFSRSCEKVFLNNFIVLKRRCNLRLFMFIGVKEFVGININRVPRLYRASQCNFSLDEPSSTFCQQNGSDN